MKHLSSYKEVKIICDEWYNIKNWSINKDGLVDVNGNVDLDYTALEKLPLNFGRIKDHFSCSYNELTSLKGAPKEINGSFRCSNNKLTNLKGAPREVGDGFYCHNNKLTSLEGTPKEIGGSFHCNKNKLTNLEDGPRKIGGSFYCVDNELTSLEGAPTKVDGDFYCGYNKLTSLEGAPKEVDGDFYCNNNNLITLEGIPYDIKKLDCSLNPIDKIWKFIDNVEYLQEFIEVYDVVRPGKVVILEYLNDIRKLMGKELVKREKIPDDWEILDI